MKYYIIIPAHNEAQFIGLTLDSLTNQTVLPSKIIVVNDNSTDNTSEIVNSFIAKHAYISLVEKKIRCYSFTRKQSYSGFSGRRKTH